MYSMNNSGPRIDPWGTTLEVIISSDFIVLCLTACFQIPLMPYCSSFLIKILWLIVSNAFDKSRKIPRVYFP